MEHPRPRPVAGAQPGSSTGVCETPPFAMLGAQGERNSMKCLGQKPGSSCLLTPVCVGELKRTVVLE